MVAADKQPVFAHLVSVSEDGGSAAYNGLGYRAGTYRKMYGKRGSPEVKQEYGAWIVFSWKGLFPQVWWCREDLEFRKTP
jgi:hypothetical protein